MKLRPPAHRAGLVRRGRVLGQLAEAAHFPVISIIAPPGYGKTTVMSQYQTELNHESAWLTLDESDSDPAVLLTSIAEALASAGLVDASLQLPLGRNVLASGVAALGKAVDPSQNALLMLDQVDHLQSQAALDVIGAVLTRLTGALRVVVATRTGDGLPFGLLRARNELFEIDARDLAMSAEEAIELFDMAEVPTDGNIESVVERTEGWPAGIYLIAMAIKAGSPAPEVQGDDIFLADYLRQELLDNVPEEVMSFLLRTSILTRMSGPLCDDVLDQVGAAETLDRLGTANLLVVPMDRTRTWYRYHSLLRDYLQSELGRSHPTQMASLHARAGNWFERNGFTELAANHYLNAGDSDSFASLVKSVAREVYSAGRVETVMGWLTALEDDKGMAGHPDLAAIGAFVRALEGDAGGSARLAVHAFTTPDEGRREDSELGPFALMLRAVQAERGVEQALDDAGTARRLFETTDLEWLHPVMGAEALATQAIDGLEASERIWTDALWRSEALGASPFTSMALAERALIAIARDDWVTAGGYVSESLDIIRAGGLERYVTSALSYTVAARLAAREGDVERAGAHLASAALVRPSLTVAIPLMAVQHLHEMVKALIEVGDVAGARRVMRDAADIIVLRPRLGNFVSDHAALKEQLSGLPAGSVGASSLTKAELRLLPLLVTHLTYPELGDRLFVSRHTIKTQAMSIYRKLGVSSRAEAVAKAREVGLLSV